MSGRPGERSGSCRPRRGTSTAAREPTPAELVAALEATLWGAVSVARVFTYVSDGAGHLLGHERELWLSEPDFGAGLIYAEGRSEALDAFDRAIETGRGEDVEYRVVSADGRLVWLHNALRAVR